MLMLSPEVSGTEVYPHDGKNVGHIDQLMMDNKCCPEDRSCFPLLSRDRVARD